jgi:outer membrane biosynthesis protein TonB
MANFALEDEREHQIIGLVVATVISAVLLTLMIFVKIFQVLPKNEEIIEYVEVNFGKDAAGFGKVQTYNKANASPRAEDVKKADDTPKVKARPTPKVTPPPTPKIDAPKPVKAAPVKPPITTKAESPAEVKENTKPVKTETKAPTPPVEAPAKPAPKRIDEDALFKKSSGSASGSNGNTGKASGVGGNNNGDKPGAVGDQGNPNGKIDAGSLYGKAGGAKTGVALNVSGWGMGRPPQINDDSDESGKIVFELTVDDSGDIVNVRVRETTVSQSIVEIYKRAVGKMKLVPKSDNPPPTSKGTLTFIIKSR